MAAPLARDDFFAAASSVSRAGLAFFSAFGLPAAFPFVSFLPEVSGDAAAPAGGSDPKWQEVATKLDLAKAYEEMGDKDGARELLNEVMKDGDAAQKGTAQQLLAKLG